MLPIGVGRTTKGGTASSRALDGSTSRDAWIPSSEPYADGLVPVRLQPRDVALLYDVWRYRFVESGQLRELHWPAARPLRAWQQAAAAAVFDHPGDAFLASATPAAGKTTFGLHVAHRMLTEGRVSRVAVIAPTTHICRQWGQ